MNEYVVRIEVRVATFRNVPETPMELVDEFEKEMHGVANKLGSSAYTAVCVERIDVALEKQK